jgi:putative ABC transport system permease protein
LLLIARKNLFSERTRLALSVGGVALAVFLITLLLSLYRGWEEKIGGFIEESDIDLWIASEGATSFISAASILPEEGSEALDQFAQIEQWSPVIVRPMEGIRVRTIPENTNGIPEGTTMDVQLIGFDQETGMGAPLRIIEGEETLGPSQIIVDEMLSKRYGVRIGDTLYIGGHYWDVVGKTTGADLAFAQGGFVRLEDAREALFMEGLTTFYAVKLMEGRNPEVFARELESLQPRIRVFTKEELASSTRDQILGEILPILAVILTLSFIVGLAIAGLTIYTATIEKAREYGILKAVGFTNPFLYRVVFEQSMVTGVLGFIVGVGLTLIVGPFASDLVPQFILLTRWQDVLAVAGVTLLMAMIAGYIPVRRLAGIDPVAVFKA